MSEKEKLFCPTWLYEVSVGITIFDFLTKEFSIEMIAKKFSEGLSEGNPISRDIISSGRMHKIYGGVEK